MTHGLIVIPVMLLQLVITICKGLKRLVCETFQAGDQGSRIEEMKNRRIQRELRQRERNQ